MNIYPRRDADGPSRDPQPDPNPPKRYRTPHRWESAQDEPEPEPEFDPLPDEPLGKPWRVDEFSPRHVKIAWPDRDPDAMDWACFMGPNAEENAALCARAVNAYQAPPVDVSEITP